MKTNSISHAFRGQRASEPQRPCGMVFLTTGMAIAGFCGLCLITNSEKIDQDTAIAIWVCAAFLALGIGGTCMMSQAAEAERRRDKPALHEEDYPFDEF